MRGYVTSLIDGKQNKGKCLMYRGDPLWKGGDSDMLTMTPESMGSYTATRP